MQLPIMCEWRSVATCLINLKGIWSAPVEQSNLFYFLNTWFYVTCIRLNNTLKLHWLKRECRRFHGSFMASNFVTRVRSMLMAKYLFSLFGSNCNGQGLQLNTRLIHLHSSFGRLVDIVLQRNSLLVSSMTAIILFLTDLKANQES